MVGALIKAKPKGIEDRHHSKTNQSHLLFVFK
jgi:hypothetical protein